MRCMHAYLSCETTTRRADYIDMTSRASDDATPTWLQLTFGASVLSTVLGLLWLSPKLYIGIAAVSTEGIYLREAPQDGALLLGLFESPSVTSAYRLHPALVNVVLGLSSLPGVLAIAVGLLAGGAALVCNACLFSASSVRCSAAACARVMSPKKAKVT